jgi:hypothetical protein
MSFYLKYREISKLWQQNKSSKTTLSTRRKSHNKRSETQTPAKSRNDTWWISKYEWCTWSQDTTNQNTVFTIYKFWLNNCGSWTVLRIGECSSNSPFLKNNWARPIVFKEWRDTRTLSNLNSTHCTLLILLIIYLVTKKKSVYSI